MKTELIQQLTSNETGRGISTPVTLASRPQLLVRQNTHNYHDAVKDSNLESLVSLSDFLITVQVPFKDTWLSDNKRSPHFLLIYNFAQRSLIQFWINLFLNIHVTKIT